MQATLRVVGAAALAVSLLDGAAARPEDEVTSLPGFDGPLPSKHYSGYLPVGDSSGAKGYIHYWLIESENDPVNDPIVYWTNGGPGGSGISTGLLTEMGQIHANDNSFVNDTIKVFHNPYSWSKVANMVYVSQPKGVGYSYCEEQPCINTDETSAQDAYDFFVAFFEAFPQYKANDFYLTAESYGGIYIPMFMDLLDSKGGVPNFKGAAIGDGCWGNQVGTCAFSSGKAQEISVEFLGGHALYSQTTYAEVKSACGNFSNADVQNTTCALALRKMSTESGNYYTYNVYDTCGGDQALTYEEYQRALSSDTVVVNSETDSHPHPQIAQAMMAKQSASARSASRKLLAGVGGYPCGASAAASEWIAQESVQQALHVKSNTGGMTYKKGPMEMSGDLRPLYAKLIPKYRMMIYSGDSDACVPYWGTEQWVRELGFGEKKGWRQWTSPMYDGGEEVRAGYVIDYDTNDFKLVTIQGAGHMVPQFKPNFALTMFKKFINNEDF